MPDLRFDIDIKTLTDGFGNAKKELEKDLKKAVGGLASMTHAKVNELANNDLKSLSKKYKDALSFQQLEDNLWVVSLDMDKAGFIEDGRKSGFMQELLDSPKAKTSKDGNKYLSIPFEHSKNPTEQSSQAKALTDEIRAELKKRDIPYRSKLEYHSDGSPKLGLLHRFNIESARLKDTHKDSPLKGVAIYQRKNEKTGKVRRDIMTFRTISSKSKEEGRWIHPGMMGKFLFEKAWRWAEAEWEQKILPEILNKHR